MATSKKTRQPTVTLSLDPEEFAFAEREGQRFGYFGAADFLQGLLNTAVIEAMDALDDPYSREVRALRKQVEKQDMRIAVLKELLGAATHANHELARENRTLSFGPEPSPPRMPASTDEPSDEIDDGIPF